MEHCKLFLDLELKAEVHPLERQLIEMMRSIGSGEVSTIKIQDGLPVIVQVAMQDGIF